MIPTRQFCPACGKSWSATRVPDTCFCGTVMVVGQPTAAAIIAHSRNRGTITGRAPLDESSFTEVERPVPLEIEDPELWGDPDPSANWEPKS